MKKGKKLRQRIAELERANAILVDLVARNNAKDTIEAVFAGITPLFIGYQNPVAEIATKDPPSMDERNEVWFPEVEFDVAMEDPTLWPAQDRGQISAPMKMPSNGQYASTSVSTAINDAQMFQAGATAPPPDFEAE